jgi:tight adherence protein C
LDLQLILMALFGMAVAGTVMALALGLRSRGEARAVDWEELVAGGAAPTLSEVELSEPFRQRVLAPIARSVLDFLGRRMPAGSMEDLRHRLEVAGRPYGWTVAQFMGIRVLSALLLSLLAFLLLVFADLTMGQRLLLVAALGGLGYYLPLLWLGWIMNQRKAGILRALPDGLDMLNICVGAGLGFDAALTRVGERWQSPLSDEFNRLVLEMRLGKPRRQALLDLAKRTEVPEVENFVATIVQADQLGVSIAKVLATQAEQMRIIRRQRAEEAAREATIKLLFPLVFLIFPALLAVLIGPAIPQLLRTFTSL